MKDLSTTFHRVLSGFEKNAHRVMETLRDVWATVSHPEAMPDSDRRMSEAEFVAGVGEILIAPQAPGGVFMIVDGIRRLSGPGHRWRMRHNVHRFARI